ncbi:MAG: hypothetical protein A2351_06080 [Omnitrophica bacterium RIFOXYB12_FULL_50_7]|nr:MAG: hypothetical protein A2351_06080 [Omnitrophica bacterium RIFOXYB12_FULL_50_7]
MAACAKLDAEKKKKDEEERKKKEGEEAAAGKPAQEAPAHANGLKNVPLRDQHDPKNGAAGEAACGPTALGMALEYFGMNVPTKRLIRETGVVEGSGANFRKLVNEANKFFPNSHFSWGTAFGQDPMTYLKNELNSGGLVIVPVVGDYADGRRAVPEGHFLLVTDVKDGKVYANDPGDASRVVMGEDNFLNVWKSGEGTDRKPCLVIHK